MERVHRDVGPFDGPLQERPEVFQGVGVEDRKSTRLNSSHLVISYAVFCLKKKNSTSVSDSPNTSAKLLCTLPVAPPTLSAFPARSHPVSAPLPATAHTHEPRCASDGIYPP